MDLLKSIICIVQRGKADKIIDAALKAGAEGATSFYAHGTGVRQKLGFIGKFIQAEKEVVLIVVKNKQTESVFQDMVKTGELDKPGKGFAFIQSIEKAIGFLGAEE
jgi:nitrogen regulatory protein PII